MNAANPITKSSEPSTSSAPLLHMRKIARSFPGVCALAGVDLELRAGEVLALLGENGAGKSTLIKILGGALPPDGGSIEIEGQTRTVHTPLAAQRAGVSVIYQEFNLVPHMSARDNIFLGQEPGRLSFLPIADERRRAGELFERLGVRVDPDALCRDLSVAQQQVVEIAKALALKARIIVMDEPSAALSPAEVERLFAVIGELKRQEIGVIYVTHRLSEVFQIADRVTVLRDGEHVATRPASELSREVVIELMVGRKLENEFPPRSERMSPTEPPREKASAAPPPLAVQDLRRGKAVKGVSFELRRGEILALTGLVGSGRTETVRLIFGADQPDAGRIMLDGRPVRIRHPRHAIAAGVCLLTEDRKGQGLVLGLTAQENFSLPNVPRFSRFGFVDARREREAFDAYIDQLRIKLTGRGQISATLSGGNQQKLVLAKWLQRNARVIIFDEPTRGIDVGAKYEIYTLMNQFAAEGKSILMISSELPEVLGMADRILVMHEGRITGEITGVENATAEQIMDLAVK